MLSLKLHIKNRQCYPGAALLSEKRALINYIGFIKQMKAVQREESYNEHTSPEKSHVSIGTSTIRVVQEGYH